MPTARSGGPLILLPPPLVPAGNGRELFFAPGIALTDKQIPGGAKRCQASI